MRRIVSKLPEVGTTIFTTMSSLAKKCSAINLGQGFPDFDCPQEIKDRINFHLQQGRNQYAPMSGVPELKWAIADKIKRSYGLELDADREVTVTAGATQGLFTAIMALVGRGDEVIVIEPAYDSYVPSIVLAGGKPVTCELDPPDFTMNWERLASLVTSRTKLIVINTPHNPIGKIFSEKDMLALQDLVTTHDLFVLSDEVYEHLVFDDANHQSVCRFKALFERSFAVYSFGKTFHATGWKMGYVVAPEDLMKEFRKVHQFNVFSANSFVQYALADILTNPASYDYLPSFFQKKRDLLSHHLAGSGFRPISCEGTYFQLFDYTKLSDMDDLAFCKYLTTQHGVAAIPISVFYTSQRQAGVMRLCFAKKEDTLISAAARLQRVRQ